MPSHDEGAGATAASPAISNKRALAAGRARVAGIQRSRLLAAMIEVSAEVGLADATVARVVGRAGVSRRTFYELFADREECFLAAFDAGVVQASRCVLDVYDVTAGWVERLRMALTGLLSFFDVEDGVGQLLVVGSLGAGTPVLERRQRVLAQMVSVVDEGRVGSGSDPPPLTAEGVVGGVLSIIHARMIARARSPQDGLLLGLVNELMSMIVRPYLGSVAARRELNRPVPEPRTPVERTGGSDDPLRDLGIRLTYRTVQVLMSVAASPGSSNCGVGEASGVADQGQISKLLGRLERLGLICNKSLTPGRGAPNAWSLTEKGARVERVMRSNTDCQPVEASAARSL